jgi:hypothetical protein
MANYLRSVSFSGRLLKVVMITHCRRVRNWPARALCLAAVLASIGLTEAQSETNAPGSAVAGRAALKPNQGFTVRGIVVDPDGRPLAGVPVNAGFGIGNVTRLPPARTDAGGQFEIGGLSSRQLILTACASDFAVTSVIVDVQANVSGLRLQAAARQPLRMRAVDGEGQPVPGVEVGVDQYDTQGQLLDFSGKTGPDGLFAWSNAPVSAFTLRASWKAGESAQKMQVTAEQREVVFHLRRGMSREVFIDAKAHDARSGPPVPLTSVGYQSFDREGFKLPGERAGDHFHLAIPASSFRVGGFIPVYQLKVEAKGYQSLVTPFRGFDEGDWSVDFGLEASGHADHAVLLPDGSPAAGARIWSGFEKGQMGLLAHQSNPIQQDTYYGERLTQSRAGEDGAFELPNVPDEATVIFTHASGFLKTIKGEAKRQKTVRLEPLGKVQGILKVAGKPQAGMMIMLTSLGSGAPQEFMLGYQTSSAADGSFAFADVPAGEYKLYRYRARFRGGVVTEDHQMPVTVEAGQAVTVEYSNPGRAVIGQAVPDNRALEIDWLNDDHTLTLQQTPAAAAPGYSDFATTAAYQQARARFDSSPARWKQMREARTYVLDFERDGSFRVEDVPPGTYSLRIQVTKPRTNNVSWPFLNPEDNLGSLAREVTVPPGEGPLDLGTLPVKVKGNEH